MNIIKKNWPTIILTISLIAILSALTAEYVFNIFPCEMCLYQIYPYYFIIIFSLIYFFSKKISLVLYYWISFFAIIIGLFYAVWHVGIEKKILPGLSGCSSIINNSKSINDLKEQIINQNIISCDEITWSFFGLSAATLNSILLCILLLINMIILIESHLKRQKRKFN